MTPFLRYDDSDCVAGVTDEAGWATTVIVVLAEAGSARRSTAEGSTSPVTVIVCSPGVVVAGRRVKPSYVPFWSATSAVPLTEETVSGSLSRVKARALFGAKSFAVSVSAPVGVATAELDSSVGVGTGTAWAALAPPTARAVERIPAETMAAARRQAEAVRGVSTDIRVSLSGEKAAHARAIGSVADGMGAPGVTRSSTSGGELLH